MSRYYGNRARSIFSHWEEGRTYFFKQLSRRWREFYSFHDLCIVSWRNRIPFVQMWKSYGKYHESNSQPPSYARKFLYELALYILYWKSFYMLFFGFKVFLLRNWHEFSSENCKFRFYNGFKEFWNFSLSPNTFDFLHVLCFILTPLYHRSNSILLQWVKFDRVQLAFKANFCLL